MIPRTISNLGVFEVMSALQKHIRRGEEQEAMHCACEMGHTSKAFLTMCVNRLEITAHEDIGLANPQAVIFTTLAADHARRVYDQEKPGKWRLVVGNTIRLLCRSPKSREGDHFQAAIGAKALLDNIAPKLPEYAFDMHTVRGRKAGKGLKNFREVSTLLVPAPTEPDLYEEEAYKVWVRKAVAANKKGKGDDTDQADLF